MSSSSSTGSKLSKGTSEFFKNLSSTSSRLFKKSENSMETLFKNPYIMAFVKLLIVLYAAQLAPKQHKYVTELFNNTFFKIFALTLIVYVAEKDLQLALILAITFVLGSNLLANRGLFESFADYSDNYTSSSTSKLLVPKAAIYPGCQNITVNDLLKAFDNDNRKLFNTVQYAYSELLRKANDKPAKELLMQISYASGLPYNMELNDTNAPYIATVLMYNGFIINDKCTAPN